MYLTRMELDPQRRSVLRLLASAERVHGVVESAFSGPRSRNLWRLDNLHGRLYLLVLSEDWPDFSKAAAEYGPEQGEGWQTKDYSPLLDRVAAGSQWQFRLTANPTKSISIPGQRGEVKACKTVSEQEKWLLDRAEQHGFSLVPGEFQVVQDRWRIFQKAAQDHTRVVLRGITYEGYLTVTDPERFRQALTAGIGRGKAYGMGLLTLMRR